MIITYTANILFVIFILFMIWFVVCSIIYRYKQPDNLTGQQSERQERNDDYNNNYYP